jgi:hypothetical protein
MNYSFSLFIACILISLVSCENQQNKEDVKITNEITVQSLKEQIQEIDDSLNVLFEQRMEDDNFEIDRLVYHEGINRCIRFYESFPDDEYAPYSLEKAAGLYDALTISQKASDWRDTLINRYPEYERMLFILEQQKAHYDNFDTYVPEKIKLYINKMLAFEDLPAEKREQLEFRLENIDLNFMDIVKLRNPDLEM